MKKFLIIFSLLLVGCSSAPKQYAECTVPVTRDAGMGVMVDGCVVWTIGSFSKQPQKGLLRIAPHAR